jgi:predicted N-acetyltransferase YhbS
VTVAIRPELARDRDASLELERAAFDSEAEAAIVEAVRDEPGSFALVAVDEGRVIGHVQLSRARIGAQEALALGPIGVRPDRQGAGIGSLLVSAALDAAGARGEVAVILLGDPGWYPRFGFRAASELGLRNPFVGVQEDGFEIHEEDFMVAILDEEASFAGPVRFHPAFGEPSAGGAFG